MNSSFERSENLPTQWWPRPPSALRASMAARFSTKAAKRSGRSAAVYDLAKYVSYSANIPSWSGAIAPKRAAGAAPDLVSSIVTGTTVYLARIVVVSAAAS